MLVEESTGFFTAVHEQMACSVRGMYTIICSSSWTQVLLGKEALLRSRPLNQSCITLTADPSAVCAQLFLAFSLKYSTSTVDFALWSSLWNWACRWDYCFPATTTTSTSYHQQQHSEGKQSRRLLFRTETWLTLQAALAERRRVSHSGGFFLVNVAINLQFLVLVSQPCVIKHICSEQRR